MEVWLNCYIVVVVVVVVVFFLGGGQGNRRGGPGGFGYLCSWLKWVWGHFEVLMWKWLLPGLLFHMRHSSGIIKGIPYFAQKIEISTLNSTQVWKKVGKLILLARRFLLWKGISFLFWIKKYIRNAGKSCLLGGKFGLASREIKSASETIFTIISG